jgi:hypothetical protein
MLLARATDDSARSMWASFQRIYDVEFRYRRWRWKANLPSLRRRLASVQASTESASGRAAGDRSSSCESAQIADEAACTSIGYTEVAVARGIPPGSKRFAM